MFVSFAQNFEDVLLWRALKHIDQGFYIDIGAQHPEADSVSKAFYDHDWRGVHVEPIRPYADLLRDHRPDEVVLEVALAAESGILTFYNIPETGLSTADSTIAEGHWHQGFTVQEITIPCIPLSDVFARYGDRDIHWVKIDVEGFELAVLEGWGDSAVRPWIVVVESTLPNTQIDTHEIWEAQLLERGYTPAFFDGLNRYYVAEQHPELLEALQYGPTVFDQFAFSPQVTHTYTVLFRQQLNLECERAQQVLDQERDRAQQLEAAWNGAKQQIEALNRQEQALQQTLAQEQDRVQQLVQQLESQKEDATSQIQALRIQLSQREYAVERERDRTQAFQAKWNTVREKNENLNKRATQARREANRLSQELTSVYSSLSWKFGAPLRLSKRAAKKVLRLLGIVPTPVVQPPAAQRQPNSKARRKANAQAGQPLPSPAGKGIPAGQSAEVSELTAELNQVSATTQQVYQRLMQARQDNQKPD